MTKTFIPGKDEALETSIANIGQAIQDLGFHIEEARWLNPAPYIWSVHIRDRDCPQVFSNGKGASRQAALASAYGELIERLSTRYLWADFMLDPVYRDYGHIHQADERWFPVTAGWPADLLDRHWLERYIEPQGLRPDQLLDMNGGGTGQGLCALPYVRQRDGETVYVPVNLIANLFVSNGMSAGNNREEAIVQGLSELFERAIKNRIISEAIALPEVPAEVLARYPHIRAGIAALQAAGFGVRALDASLGGRYPVMCVLLQHPDGGVYASFGAHPTFAVALERALTELLQGRALDELEGFPAPTTDMDMVAEPHNLELHFIDSSGYVSWALLSDQPDLPFVDWDANRPWASDNHTACTQLIGQLHDEGHEVYIAEHTGLGAYACRILIPGFSDIYLPDELVLNNNNACLPVRPVLFHLPNAGPEGWQQLLDTLEEQHVNDQLKVLEWAGIVGDASRWGRIRVGEFKVWLRLALGDLEGAFEHLPAVLASGDLAAPDRADYAALHAVLELHLACDDPSPYRRALDFYHGKAKVTEALAWVRGEVRFPGLPALDPEAPTEGHRQLLLAYRKVLDGQRRQRGG
ncbi:30S ribosomal protein S12 methylthiotransferase accessory factor YcaO [uncultured Marinobacter sp.]|uniref:30S ribosomal protein S12 methylthiotransferase accessory factor YcaO n=1 Tax=uncultured Marinobacter sp. TaxID=187379 RepID=UPI000C0B385D|nr:30S ribosomal protein S12 methylthiotransferase accessory protein YcaO [Marinobacter sp.]MBI43768.1 30S ribosomal protein S12 methylthiotransferase accessory protein YcaO [Oceanospirillales bacterium]|tara:strand:+ start:731 stop:2473 length:1743 start_codon:yes stop_codon:yes gene_type:complete